jgi:hypothetical protein
MSRRDNRRDRPAPANTDEFEPDADASLASSIEDLQPAADPNQFDQTFTDQNADLDIQGEFDAVAGPKQVIPRIAYVLNFNLIYNEDKDRWEPQTDFSSGGSGGGSTAATNEVTVLEKTSTQSSPNPGFGFQLSYQQTGADTLGAADLANNQIVVPEDGVYRCSMTAHFDSQSGLQSEASPRVRLRTPLRVFSEFLTNDDQDIDTFGLSLSTSKPVELSAGDEVQGFAQYDQFKSVEVRGNAEQTYLSVTRLS